MSLVSVTIEDHVATVVIDPREGRYDRAFMQALGDAAEQVGGAPDDVRAVVLHAAGGAFGAGWTAEALAGHDGIDGLSPLGGAFDALAAAPQPVVAAVRGAAHSAGLELALACDIRIAAEDATFAMPETEAGLVPRGGGTQRLPRAVGRAHALRLLLLGETVDAAEARRIGLVSVVVPSTEVVEAATRVARTVASRGPIATRLAKEAVHRGAEMPLQDALRYELDLTVLLQTTEDRAEGVQAFIEKRPPRFIGR
ncbi:MAG: hypothetical protein GEU80_03820 [Dehalococcoidia bacterium]|nr:hypothetical protein [Dehalococcoidia bacterium]